MATHPHLSFRGKIVVCSSSVWDTCVCVCVFVCVCVCVCVCECECECVCVGLQDGTVRSWDWRKGWLRYTYRISLDKENVRASSRLICRVLHRKK